MRRRWRTGTIAARAWMLVPDAPCTCNPRSYGAVALACWLRDARQPSRRIASARRSRPAQRFTPRIATVCANTPCNASSWGAAMTIMFHDPRAWNTICGTSACCVNSGSRPRSRRPGYGAGARAKPGVTGATASAASALRRTLRGVAGARVRERGGTLCHCALQSLERTAGGVVRSRRMAGCAHAMPWSRPARVADPSPRDRPAFSAQATSPEGLLMPTRADGVPQRPLTLREVRCSSRWAAFHAAQMEFLARHHPTNKRLGALEAAAA